RVLYWLRAPPPCCYFRWVCYQPRSYCYYYSATSVGECGTLTRGGLVLGRSGGGTDFHATADFRAGAGTSRGLRRPLHPHTLHRLPHPPRPHHHHLHHCWSLRLQSFHFRCQIELTRLRCRWTL